MNQQHVRKNKMKKNYNSNVHATLLAAVGGYILYLAWVLFGKYRDGAGEMPPALNIIAVIVFSIGGLGTLYYAWYVYRKGRKTENEREDEETQDNH